MVIEHAKADVVHDAVKVIGHGKAAGDLDAVSYTHLRVSSVSGIGAAVGVTVRPLAPPLGELLIYLVDNIWQHRTGDEPIGKATRTEQMILREFYAYLYDYR